MKLRWTIMSADRGDTLVEVLLATVIVTSVVAGAFAVSQKSSAAVQDSKERGEALQLVQGQIETVRALALKEPNATSGIFSSSPKYFCVDSSNTLKPLPANLDITNLDTEDFNLYNNTGCQLGPDNRYNVAIWYDSSSPKDKRFVFTIAWDNAMGHRSQEQLSYRILPDSPLPIPTPAPSPSPGQPIVSPLTCEQVNTVAAATPGMQVIDLTAMGSDWHVSSVPPVHMQSSNPYSFSTPLAAGQYFMWVVAKDSSYNPSAHNQVLSYFGLDASKKIRTFQTGWTADLPPTAASAGGLPFPQGGWTTGIPVTVTQSTPYLMVEHLPYDPSSNSDSVDAYCFAYDKVN